MFVSLAAAKIRAVRARRALAKAAAAKRLAIQRAREADEDEETVDESLEALMMARFERIPTVQQLAASSDWDMPECRGIDGRVYGGDSTIFNLPPGYPPRKWAIVLVDAQWFEAIILLTIMTNCLTMAWESPLDQPGTYKAHMILFLEHVFLAIFTVELLLKVLAYGLFSHDGSYLRDRWCQFDFIVVALTWLPILVPSFGNFSVIRSLRVRVLKSQSLCATTVLSQRCRGCRLAGVAGKTE